MVVMSLKSKIYVFGKFYYKNFILLYNDENININCLLLVC